MKKFIYILHAILVFSTTSTLFSNILSEQSKPVHARFVDAPIKKKPLMLLVLRGLGVDPESVQKSFQQKFKDLDVKIKVLDYNKVGLGPFEQTLLDILKVINETKTDEKKENLLHEKEKTLLPELRSLITENLDKILAEFDGIPPQNIIVAGYSFGGLVSSVLIEVLGSSQKGQVQALLTTMSPPVGFINCTFCAGDVDDGLTKNTLFPWVMHVEMGEKDPIWTDGVLKMQKCFNIFMRLDKESKDHFTNDSHEGDHSVSENFDGYIRNAITKIAKARQEGKKQEDIPISVMN